MALAVWLSGWQDVRNVAGITTTAAADGGGAGARRPSNYGRLLGPDPDFEAGGGAGFVAERGTLLSGGAGGHVRL
jgi:hypothetical protein